MKDRYQFFRDLNYASFQKMAQQDDLSVHQKIGFPNELRAGYTGLILADIKAKLPALTQPGCTIADIGPGCGDLGAAIVASAQALQQDLWLIDAPEVLDALPGSARCQRIPGRFPDETGEMLAPLRGKCAAVICYSVFHYVFNEGNVHRFLDEALSLLAPGGGLLLGDLPNNSMLRRFLDSDRGRQFHREYAQCDEDPLVEFNTPSHARMDDGVLMGLLLRARLAGFHAYLVPQSAILPMANRREDLLFIRP